MQSRHSESLKQKEGVAIAVTPFCWSRFLNCHLSFVVFRDDAEILYILAVVAEADEVAGLGEGIPGDVEPAGARQQLVGIGAGLEEFHEALELRWVLRADIGSLTAEVLRAADATHQAVHPAVAEA